MHLVDLCCKIILKFMAKKTQNYFYIDTIDTVLSIKIKSPNLRNIIFVLPPCQFRSFSNVQFVSQFYIIRYSSFLIHNYFFLFPVILFFLRFCICFIILSVHLLFTYKYFSYCSFIFYNYFLLLFLVNFRRNILLQTFITKLHISITFGG